MPADLGVLECCAEGDEDGLKPYITSLQAVTLSSTRPSPIPVLQGGSGGEGVTLAPSRRRLAVPAGSASAWLAAPFPGCWPASSAVSPSPASHLHADAVATQGNTLSQQSTNTKQQHSRALN